MKKMEIYEPAMCCSTGLCGVNVDAELLRVATALEHLKSNGIIVNRYNLSSAPQAFIVNKEVAGQLQSSGIETLPLIVVDGEIVIKKRYPTNEEICSLLEIPCECVTSNVTSCCAETPKQCSCGGDSNSSCCGSNPKKGGGCC